MGVRCLITDGKNYELNKWFVEDTLKYFPDYDFNIMKATISGWQSSQLKDNEDRLPTILELIDYLLDSAKRENNNNIKVIADKALLILNNLSTYDKELQDILAKAPRDSQGRLLAPNGKPSNLTERQYAQVRTKAFKDWFGDWEKAFIQSKYEPVASNQKFKHSLFRGQASVPEIDADGNLHLRTRYDSLSKLKTLSFASVKNEALHYGYRVAKNPYIIEINEDYLDNILPKEEYEKEKVESRHPFRYDEEFNEVRLSFNDEIVIPKGQYNVTHNEKTIDITDLDSAIVEILDVTRLMFKRDSQEYNGISELEGAVSSQDIKESYNKIIDILGEKYYNIIAISELSKNQELQYYIPVNNNTIQNYINEGYLIEKDYDLFTEEDLKTLPSEVIEQIKKERSYYELTDKAKKEINNVIKSNKTNNNASKVVDENDEPLVVYSGRPTKGTTIFNLNSKRNRTTLTSLVKKGIYFTKDKEIAEKYSGSSAYENEIDKDIMKYGFADDGGAFSISKEEFLDIYPNVTPEYYDKMVERYNQVVNDPNNPIGGFHPSKIKIEGEVISAFLNIKNPVIIDMKGSTIAHLSKNQKQQINNSEGAIIENVNEAPSGVMSSITSTTTYILFDSNQIKSATDNTGAFSSDNDDIYDSQILQQPKSTPKTLNIWAGTNENTDLSNFAKRPFVITSVLAERLEKLVGFPVFGNSYYPDEGEEVKKKSTYNSVEQAFQIAKIAFAFDGTDEAIDDSTATKIEHSIKESTPSEAKRLGRTIPMSKLAISRWDKFSSQIMKELIKASFEQNPQALQRLLATDNATLTHTLDKGKWGTEFPRLLMEVREELRQSQLKSLTRFSTSESSSYPERTKENADWSDITLALATDFNTAGEKLTKRVAGDKYIHSPLPDDGHGYLPYDNEAAYEFYAKQIYEELKKKGKISNIKLNIAGNGIYSLKGFATQGELNDYVTNLLKSLQSLGITISEIRSGGLTGIDEAGIIAALRLGIPNEVHTTSDYKFRDKSGKDTSNDEQAFKARFLQLSLTSLALLLALPRKTYTGLVNSLQDNQIFVFGSNTLGRHGAGAAKTARDKFGAIYGLAEGLQGLSYAIITKDLTKDDRKNPSRTKELIIELIHKLYEFARLNPNKEFLVAYSSTGRNLNYYSNEEMANMFASEPIPNNIVFEEGFNTLVNNSLLQLQTLSLQLILPETLPITTEQLNEPLLLNEEKIKATRDFLNPVTRKQVVLKIARMFSNIVSKEYDNLKQALDNRIANETDDKVKKELLFLRRKFNRYQVIKTMTPVAIFNKLKETYEKYVNLTDEQGKTLEKSILNKNSVFQKMPDALKDRIALMRFNNKKKAYQLILDNFKILAMEASKSFALTEGVNLTFNTNMVTLLQEQDTYDDEGNSNISGNKEEKSKEHWMIDVRTVSSFNSLTNKIRQAINNIARVNKDGILEIDDMGDTIYLSGSYVHSELIKTLAAEVTDPNDIIPILLKAAIRKPWINLIIYKILDDPILFTEMYRAYNKSTLNYWILKPRTLQDGSIKTLTISLNKIEGIDLLFETWRDNYEYGNKLEDDAIYTSDGTIIKDNVKKGLDLVNLVKDDIYYHRKDTRESKIAIVLNKDNVLKLTKAFKMLGIPLEEQTVAEAISYNIDNTLYEPDFNANTLVSALVTIYDDLLKNKEVKEDELFDMANAYGRALENVAKVISFVTEDTMESQVRHNKKSLYAHVNSGYMINLIKKLKNPDKFKDFIEKEYMPVEWFYKNGLWRNQFILNLYNNQEDRDKLQHIVMLDYNGKEYADWSTLDSTLVLINQFFSQPTKDEHGWAYYNIPVLSDTESAEFLRMRRYISNFEEIINTKFINLVKLEIDRIDLVKRRANNPNVEKIANFDMVKTVDKNGNEHIKYGGAEFKFFPELNFILVNGNSFLDEYYRLSLTETTDKVNQFIKELISFILERRFKTAIENWDKIGLFERVDDNPNGKFKYFDTNSRTTAELMLKLWYWNSSFAQSQIIELLTTDLAFYKTKGKDFLTDFIKRAKEFHAPIERLNTEAEWVVNGERKKVCYDDNGNKLKNRVLYLKDCEVPSLTLEELKEALDKNPKLTKEEKSIIIGAYLNINMADALAYRTLDSFRRTLIMAGQWSDDEETAYNNIKNGNFRLEDITVLWNTRKPYLYTQTNQGNLVDNGNIRVPVLHKNSEMIMLTLAILGTIMSTGKLAALERFMTKNNIDVVMFESAVKAGGLDIIDLNNIEASEVEDYLADYVNTYSLAIHEFDYEDYGIQTATPEHGIDDMQLVGTLIRRIIASNQDMNDPNFRFKYKNKEWTVQEWQDYYNIVNTANIKESFLQLDKKFSDIKEIEKLLLSEVRSNPRYDTDIELALTLNNDGVFNIPLLDPSITYKIQSLLTSIVKNRITKQKIAGGAFIQTSAWGFKREPKVIYNDDGSVKYIECYMPCPSEELYNMLLDDKTHEVDINKKYKGKDGKWHYIVPEKYRELIGYRVPTESFYSCAPLKVIGYLPRQCGTIMVVPRDIVSMAGSDFDVDKVYAMLHTLKFKREYNIKKAWDDFYKSHPDIVEEIDKNYGEKFDEFLKTWNEDGEDLDLEDLKDAHNDFNQWLKENGIKRYNWSETALTEFRKWFKENKLTYLLNIIPLVNEYKDIEESYIAGEPLERRKLFNHMLNNNTKELRDSLIIDLMWAVLTNKETTPKLMKPGGFDGPKKAARIATILKNNTIQSLKDLGYKIDSLISDLSELSIGLLTDIVDESSKILNPLTPDTWVTLHDRNMAGAALIAIAATNNAGHALMQHTNLLFKNPILINGRLYQSLHDIKNAEGKYITENIAEFLAAVVDNAKDPVAGDMNLNTTTAGIAFTLLRLGVNATTTALFLSLPIVQLAVDIVSKKRVSLLEAFKELTTQYTNDLKSKGKNIPELKYIEKFNFSDGWLALSILGWNNMSLGSENQFERDALLNQVRVGELMLQLSKMAQDLTDFTLATRADTLNGGAGPTIADTMNSIERYSDINPLSTSLEFWDILNPRIDITQAHLFNSNVPILQAFFSFGLTSVEKLFNKLLPYYTDIYLDMITLFKNNTRSGKLSVDTRNKIYTLYINYLLSKVVDKRFANSDEQRDYFINKFPNDFVELTNKIPNLKKYEFIERIVKLNPTKYNPAPALKFNNVGKISDILKQLYMLDWESLLYINDETRLLALDLLTYNMYRGLDFSPSGFGHLVPSVVKMVHPYYVRVLNDTLKNYATDENDLSNFFNQFIRNNLHIRELVPDTSEAQFTEVEVDGEKRITIDLNEFSPSADRKVAKPYSDKKAFEREIEFLPYIMRKINGTEHYYKLIDYMNNHAEYKETTPLGKKNKYYEYSEFEEIESVIKPSEVSNLDDKETESDGINPLDNQAPQGSGTAMMNLIKLGLLRLAGNPTKLDDSLATLNSINNLATDPSTNKPLCGGRSGAILTL